MVVVNEQGKESRSFFTRKAVYPPRAELEPGATFVDIRLYTGRTHQARAHAASIGHPIAGDTRYGVKHFNDQMKSLGLNRLFLHASWLQFSHPDTGSQIRIESPLPGELENVLQQLNHEQEI